jgi:hypothetical protein
MRHVLSGDGAPSTTPDFIGQHYIDTTNKQAYVSVGTDDAGDWGLGGGGGSSDMQDIAMTVDGSGNATLTLDPSTGERFRVTASNVTGSCNITIADGTKIGQLLEIITDCVDDVGNPVNVGFQPSSISFGGSADFSMVSPRWVKMLWGGAYWYATSVGNASMSPP